MTTPQDTARRAWQTDACTDGAPCPRTLQTVRALVDAGVVTKREAADLRPSKRGDHWTISGTMVRVYVRGAHRVTRGTVRDRNPGAF